MLPQTGAAAVLHPVLRRTRENVPSDGVAVPCLSVGQQTASHQGYDPRPQDVHDLALLHALHGG